jgi:hypothetical protein
MKGNDKRRYQLRQIIRALAWWTDDGGWKSPSCIGAIIQNQAQKLTGIKADMSALKFEAEGMLKRLKNEEARSRQLQEELNKTQSNLTMMPGKAMYPFVPYPFPTFTLSPVKTRREELEAMTDGEIRELKNAAANKELKKERINYILESEKGDK